MARQVIAFGRTARGQAVYDIYFTSLSAAEVARRNKGISREFVLEQRKVNPLRKQAIALRKKKAVKNV